MTTRREPDQRLSVFSAFTGLGGMDLGLESAGFCSVGCLETDHEAKLTLKANRGDLWPLVGNGDIAVAASELQPHDVGVGPGGLDLLAGAPPCQPFSKAAQWTATARLGTADARSTCLDHFFQLARRLQPRVLLLENVPGFVRGPTSQLTKLRVLTRELGRYCDAHYELDFRILNAADYGVPQNRHRAIIVISRVGPFTWPSASDERRTAWDALHDAPANDRRPQARGKWADLLPTIPPGENYQWHTSRGGGCSIFGYRTRYSSFLRKLHPQQPSPTIASTIGPANGPFHWANRPLSVWEMKRLQSLPSDWAIEGNTYAQVRQVGNATPPLLAEIMGRALARHLDGAVPTNMLRLQLPRAATACQLPPLPRRLPPKYSPLVGDHPDHPGAGMGPKPR
ncbi:DNA cytosine methyltransferase [Candidatus Poriferisodalis sp.]|uniref:DNA cytosine methyltransferase n=1 Tax=Candidatus Poriferisodalis sp. TaxID=3101277 RepID=UPI003B026BE0